MCIASEVVPKSRRRESYLNLDNNLQTVFNLQDYLN